MSLSLSLSSFRVRVFHSSLSLFTESGYIVIHVGDICVVGYYIYSENQFPSGVLDMPHWSVRIIDACVCGGGGEGGCGVYVGGGGWGGV